VAAAALLVAGPALAQAPVLPRVARLEYVLGPGAKGCSGEQELRSAVRSQADHEVFAADAPARMRVALSRRPRDGRYEAALDLHDSGGALLRHQAIPPMVRCADVVQAAAMIIAETLDPIQPPPPPAPPPILTVAPPPPPRATVEPDPLELHAGLGAWLSLGTAPRPAAGLSADFGLRWSPISLSAELRWDPPASAEVGGGARLSTWRLLGALVPCGHWSRESFGLFGCGVMQVGKLGATNESFVSAPGSSALYLAAGARLGAELRLTPLTPHLGLRVMGEMMATPSRGTIWIGDQPAWTMPRFSGGAGLGVVAFW
jgi:hypothetical protein